MAKVSNVVEVQQPIPRSRCEVNISVPLAPEVSGKYASGRVDIDLTRPESVICRRIQDALELAGGRCKGPAGVFRHLIAQIREQDLPGNPETRKPGNPVCPKNMDKRT